MDDFDRLVSVFERLRAPGGCPWDAKQDHKSIARSVIEEAHELFEAIQTDNVPHMREELGDILLQVIFHSIIARDQGEFTLSDVINDLRDKLIYRHPHVFGDAKADTSSEVTRNWEILKKREKGKSERKSILDGIPDSLPALLAARKIQSVVSRVGFDWQDVRGVIQKLKEEMAELSEAMEKGAATDMEEEMGDLLFSMVNLARISRIDPEAALRGTNRKFRKRFSLIEKEARKRGINLEEMTLEEMDRIWEKAKMGERE